MILSWALGIALAFVPGHLRRRSIMTSSRAAPIAACVAQGKSQTRSRKKPPIEKKTRGPVSTVRMRLTHT